MTNEIKAVVVDPSTGPRLTTIDGSLKTLQELVGGLIEGVFGPDYTMYVDEEGHLNGLEYNPEASAFARRELGAAYLVGTAVILGPGDSEGNDTSVHPNTLTYYNLEN